MAEYSYNVFVTYFAGPGEWINTGPVIVSGTVVDSDFESAEEDKVFTPGELSTGASFGTENETFIGTITQNGETFIVTRNNVATDEYQLYGNVDDPQNFTYPTITGLGDINTADAFMPPCFTEGTLISTLDGERRVESLEVGDLVWTVDHDFQPVRWIGSRQCGRERLAVQPSLRPIRISAGALGDGQPASDLLVSPQHRVLVRSNIAQRMFGCPEVLVAARQLLELDGIAIADSAEKVTYFHILFDRHELVLSNGAVTESLFTGAEALKSMGAPAREEIFAIFPELRNGEESLMAARTLVSGRMGRKLAERHHRNRKKMVSA